VRLTIIPYIRPNITMLKFLKKYKYNILFLLLFFCVDTFILPRQEAYYFDYDIENFKTTSFHILLIPNPAT
jgi:hypothetical protein